jgi:hypothetical protein
MADFQHDTSSPSEEEQLRDILPFVPSWGWLYAIVLGELALLIVLFYFFSKNYA